MDNLINKLVDDNDELQDQLVECREVKEGIVSNTDEDSEEVAIKKLTEEEYSDTEEDMEQDVVEEPAEDTSEENEEEEEVDKEYFGKAGENYYYLVGNESEEGITEDLQIVDQEGTVVYSAKDNEVEITDVVDFIIQAIQEMDIEDISYDVFEKYILPKLVEPEEEEEEEFGDENLEGEESDMIPDEEETFEATSRVKYVHEDKDYEVSLLPENKVKIGGKIFTLSDDTFKFYNIKEGKVDESDLKDLAKDMLRAMNESELKELVEGYEERGKRDGTGPYKGSRQRKVTGDKGKRKLAGEKCPAKESKVEDDSMKKTNEDITTDVKELQKKAEAAVKDGDYIKAADYVSRLANVESSVGSVEDDTAVIEPVVDEVDEPIVEEPVVEEAKEEELPDDVKEQITYLDSLLADGMNR